MTLLTIELTIDPIIFGGLMHQQRQSGSHSAGGTRVHHEQAKEPTAFISTGASDAAAVNYLNELFRRAAREKISDVHFEDTESGCVIRQRLRGEMHIVERLSTQMSREFDSKIRMRCKLSLIDRLVPLDGKFRFDVDERFVDVRVSILPLGNGQSIVCRLLDQSMNLMRLDDLQMPEDVRNSIRQIIAQPQGLFLVTGPTGSGKTTTLYGVLQQLNNPAVKIITIEDPIEFRIDGIVQAQTNLKLTFGGALKSMLRQDPDIILVGEIRDSETARIATQAALTGHIVLSTLHTNNAPVTLNRMLDLGVDPNALAAAMGGFMAQRLVRSLCPHCRVPVPMSEYARNQMKANSLTDEQIDVASEIYEPNPDGCDHCADGWSGRTAVFELILPTTDVRLAVEESNLKALERSARLQPQYRTLGQHAMELVAAGETSLNEAMATTGSGQFLLES